MLQLFIVNYEYKYYLINCNTYRLIAIYKIKSTIEVGQGTQLILHLTIVYFNNYLTKYYLHKSNINNTV